MTKKGIWASIFAVIGAICVIVALCVIGAHINKQKPVESDKILTVEDEQKGSDDKTTEDSNKEQKDTTTDEQKSDSDKAEEQTGDTSGQEQSEQPNQNQQEQNGQGDEQNQTEQGDQTGDTTVSDTDDQTIGDETQTGDTQDQTSDNTGDTTSDETGDSTGDEQGNQDGEEHADQTGDQGDEPEVPEIKVDTVGDVNTDGFVDNADVYALKVYLDGTAELTPQQMSNADVNADGSVNAFDKKLLSAYLVNVVQQLPLKISATAGDINGDKLVNVDDIKYWNANIDNLSQMSTIETARFDVNGDKFINSEDYALLGELVNDKKLNKHTVFFEGNYQDSKIIEVEVKDGNLVNNIVPAPRERFDFDGWFKDAKCTTKFDFNTVISHDMVLYAKWTAVNYVSFISDGEDTVTQSVRINEKATEFTPARDGYEFDGWFTDKARTTKYDFKTPVTKDIEIYAKWTKIFTITYVDRFYTHDGEHMVYVESKSTQKVRDGTVVTPKEFDMRRLLAGVNNGYAEFVGWSADLIDLNVWKADSKLADKIASGDVNVKMFDFKKPIKSDVTVYAKWHYTYKPAKDLKLADMLDVMDKYNADQNLTTTELFTYDLNRDNKVSVTDIAGLVNAQGAEYVNVTGNNTSCDVNKDGIVDDKDVLAAAKAVVSDGKVTVDVNGDLMTNMGDLATTLRAANYNVSNHATEKAIVGDLNRDEIVNGLDSLIISKYLDGKIGLSDQAIINADANADGKVDVNDFQVLAMFVKGLVKTLPYDYTNDVVDVNGDNVVDAADVEAWKVILEEYKKILADMEGKLDVNLDGIIDKADLEYFDNYFALNYVNFMSAVVDYNGKVITVKEMMDEILTKEKAHDFKITVKINGEQYLKDASVGVVESFILNLNQFAAGDKIEIHYNYSQGWTGSFWGQFDASWPASADQTCVIHK